MNVTSLALHLHSCYLELQITQGKFCLSPVKSALKGQDKETCMGIHALDLYLLGLYLYFPPCGGWINPSDLSHSDVTGGCVKFPVGTAPRGKEG